MGDGPSIKGLPPPHQEATILQVLICGRWSLNQRSPPSPGSHDPSGTDMWEMVPQSKVSPLTRKPRSFRYRSVGDGPSIKGLPPHQEAIILQVQICGRWSLNQRSPPPPHQEATILQVLICGRWSLNQRSPPSPGSHDPSGTDLREMVTQSKVSPLTRKPRSFRY